MKIQPLITSAGQMFALLSASAAPLLLPGIANCSPAALQLLSSRTAGAAEIPCLHSAHSHGWHPWIEPSLCTGQISILQRPDTSLPSKPLIQEANPDSRSETRYIALQFDTACHRKTRTNWEHFFTYTD